MRQAAPTRLLPFGETAMAGLPSASAVRFTGRENDGTGLYYYRARYYDPGRGRFVGMPNKEHSPAPTFT